MSRLNSLYDQTVTATNAFLQTKMLEQVQNAAVIHPRYEHMWQLTKDLVLEGGKRYRPYLVAVGFGEFSEDIIPVAAAQELIHCALLMHDDIIDQDVMRRGKLNVNGAYLNEYGNVLLETEARHYSYGTSLIAGDALIAEAFLYIQESNYDKVITTKLSQQANRAFFEVIGGQLLDVEAAFMKGAAYDPITIYRYKTASYSFIRPLVSGAICRQASNKEITRLTNIGINLGIAYQLQDDILGLIGNQQEIGKQVLLDLREAKQTYIINLHKERMNSGQADRFSKYFGNKKATQTELEKIRDDIIETDATKDSQKLAEDYLNLAIKDINKLTNKSQANELHQLIKLLINRRA